MKKFVKGGVCTLASLGLIMTMGAGTALAKAMDTEGTVTFAGGCGPNTVTGEIMGMNGVEDGGAPNDRNESWTNDQLLTWVCPHFYNWGSDEYQSQPNPYYYNYLYDKTGSSKKVVVGDTRSGDNQGGGGPNSAGLSTYGNSTRDDLVWNMLPDVIIATGTLSKSQDEDSTDVYNTDKYALAAGAANGKPNYRTIGVYANAQTFTDHIIQWYNVASAADTAAKNTGKKLRYGEAKLIANRLEAVMRGSQGYVLKQLAKEKKDKKTVCLIKSVNEDGTFTLMSNEEQDASTKNTFLQVTAAVANNLYYNVKDGTATVDDLKTCDLVMVGSLTGSEYKDVKASLPQEIQDKAYWQDTAYLATTYLLNTRSPENFNNFCRIMGCLYPEYISQSDMMAFASEQIYHIKTSKLGEYADKAYDGIRNWNAKGGEATQWSAKDIASYNVGNVEATLVEGMKYLAELGDNVPAPTTFNTLKPTANYSNAWAKNLKKAQTNLKQSIKVKKTTATFKYKTVKKAAQSFSMGASAQGTVTTSKVSGDKAISVAKNGKVTVKKGTKKGTYKATVKVAAKATTVKYPKYAAKKVNKKITVKVK